MVFFSVTSGLASYMHHQTYSKLSTTSTQPNLFMQFHSHTNTTQTETKSRTSPMELLNLPSMLAISSWFIFFLTIINQSISARTLSKPTTNHHHVRHSFTFYMRDILSQSHHYSSSKPATAKVTSQIPFPKPIGYFPPAGGIPLPQPVPFPTNSQTLDIPGMGISFPARATLEDMEVGALTIIDEALYKGAFGSVLKGKAQGVYVASSEDGSSHMMALTASFVNGDYKDGLRFFGVHRGDVSESHVAVIGGTGKYQNANGYATIKTKNLSSDSGKRTRGGAYKVLLFSVYLS